MYWLLCPLVMDPTAAAAAAADADASPIGQR
jgi:hypothetical protein